MKQKYWTNAWFLPNNPQGEDGRLVTGCEAHKQVALEAAREGMVLAKNGGVLPLQQGQKLAVFGIGQADYVRTGLGAAAIYNVKEISLLEGLRTMEQEGRISLFAPVSEYYETYFRETAASGDLSRYQPDMVRDSARYYKVLDLEGMMREPGCPAELLAQAAEFTDTAVISLSRVSGEFYDRSLTPGDFYLDAEEKKLIEAVKAHFPHVIAALNIPAQIESGWLEDEKIESVLFMWNAGQMGGLAAAKILCGKAYPSGRLADTVARDYADFPSSANFLQSEEHVDYEEDIFMGYRYFETIPGAKEKVVFPFGYGLGYTTFLVSVLSAGEDGGRITVKVSVTNAGSRAGKEVVQLYYSAPQGKLGKAARELAAFAKTRELAPGEAQELTLSFPVSSMASYDDTGIYYRSAWLLEAGSYDILCGRDVRSAEPVFRYELPELLVTEQCTECCPPQFLARRLQADGSYAPQAFRAPAAKLYPDPKPNTAQPPAELMRLDDVLEEKCSLESFLAQMSVDEMIDMVGGGPGSGVCNTGTFGTSKKYGIAPVGTCDAPGGVRVQRSSRVETTAFPTATAVACSWNEELAAKIADTIALEIKENNLYAWLAPALNLHRDPLAGRNFEYYSEDPLLAGKMAAAQTRAVQAHRISACPKHFAANNKDRNRRESDSRLSERALRELYLKGFEICVKEADPKTIMTSYNLINGEWAAQCPDTISVILRGEWGFRGMVMTDWDAHSVHAKEIMAGSDCKMPRGDGSVVRRYYQDEVLTRPMLESCMRNLCRLLLWYEGSDDWEQA